MIKILVTSLTTKYFKFKGRASRKEYWILYLFGLALCRLVFWLAVNNKDFFIQNFYYIFCIMAFSVLPFITVMVRRLHDFNFNGWWVVPITLSTVLIEPFMSSDMALFIVGLIINATLGLIPGTVDSNKYGEPPTD